MTGARLQGLEEVPCSLAGLVASDQLIELVGHEAVAQAVALSGAKELSRRTMQLPCIILDPGSRDS